jgi:hypothetical protein
MSETKKEKSFGDKANPLKKASKLPFRSPQQNCLRFRSLEGESDLSCAEFFHFDHTKDSND